MLGNPEVTSQAVATVNPDQPVPGLVAHSRKFTNVAGPNLRRVADPHLASQSIPQNGGMSLLLNYPTLAGGG